MSPTNPALVEIQKAIAAIEGQRPAQAQELANREQRVVELEAQRSAYLSTLPSMSQRSGSTLAGISLGGFVQPRSVLTLDGNDRQLERIDRDLADARADAATQRDHLRFVRDTLALLRSRASEQGG